MNKLLQLYDKYALKIVVCLVFAFTILYPKLPSIQITHTWVYIRLEDFAIGLATIMWFIQLLRRKVKIPFVTGTPLVIYWIVGLISLIFCFIVILPTFQPTIFPHVAILEYLRRIEYMILFFIGYASIQNKKDIKDFILVICFSVLAIILYGFGQEFYINLYTTFPNLVINATHPFCFPSFQTGNEEFAKGLALCLPKGARITSTFGGHYDLAGFLVIIVPVIFGIFLGVKRWFVKILSAILFILSVMLLVFTSSRVSFFAYLAGVVAMPIFFKQKRWILPVLVVSIGILVLFSGSTLQRILATIQPVNQVTFTSNSVNANLKKEIDKSTQDVQNQQPQEVPHSSSIIQNSSLTQVASTPGQITTILSNKELQALQDKDISTVSGSFLIQKAYSFDISFTTRFQSEWPRDWNAFLSSPLLGTGYSSLTLASDGDYIRMLGETGALGFISFMFIFALFGIYFRKTEGTITDSLTRGFLFGIAGGIVGLLVNALMIDVFEASKVAEPLWILLGVGIASASLYQKKAINYTKEINSFFTSKVLIASYLLISSFVFIGNSIGNFFVADDFTWLHWAASGTSKSIAAYFTNADGFFYRPLDKTIIYALYQLFSFQPQGYHLFALITHFLMVWAVFLLANKLFRNKFIAFISALVFLVMPSHAENVFWFATISTNLASVFMMYGLLAYMHMREKKSVVGYILTLIFAVLALLSYEMAVIFPLFLILVDVIWFKLRKFTWVQLGAYVPFALLSVLYVVIRPLVHTVAAGGDYSYNIVHFIPNFFGNLYGYFGMFLFDQSFMPIYIASRMALKIYALPILCIVLFILVLSFIFGRKVYMSLFTRDQFRIPLFGIAFIIISLLPFIGLGNITERYGYLSSVGFVLVLGYLLLRLYTYLKAYSVQVASVGMVLITLGLVGWYGNQLHSKQLQWNHSGLITFAALKEIRNNYDSIADNSILYFVNIPIRQQEAWIFPVGLEDGVWFIYRDKPIIVKKAATVGEAKALIAGMKRSDQKNAYIFEFDKAGKLSAVK